jgi:hypothetical protein
MPAQTSTEARFIESLRRDGENLVSYAFLINAVGRRQIALANAMEKDLSSQESLAEQEQQKDESGQ